MTLKLATRNGVRRGRPRPPAIIFADPEVLCVILKSLEEEGTTSAAQALRYYFATDVPVIRLPEMTWDGVDLIRKIVTVNRILASGNIIPEPHKMSSAGWDILLQQLAKRKRGDNFVFPSSVEGGLAGEVRRVLAKVIQRAGLKGRGLNLTILRRSHELAIQLLNISKGEDLTIPARESSQPLDASLMLARQKTTKPRIFKGMRFGDLPVRFRTCITKSTIAEMSLLAKEHEHQQFWNGVNHGLKWVFGASLAAIANIAEEYSELTSTAFFNGDKTIKPFDYLRPTHTSYMVAHINGFAEYVPATENTIQFEAGFHSVVRAIHQNYSEH